MSHQALWVESALSPSNGISLTTQSLPVLNKLISLGLTVLTPIHAKRVRMLHRTWPQKLLMNYPSKPCCLLSVQPVSLHFAKCCTGVFTRASESRGVWATGATPFAALTDGHLPAALSEISQWESQTAETFPGRNLAQRCNVWESGQERADQDKTRWPDKHIRSRVKGK